jgi:hypothetical protein
VGFLVSPAALPGFSSTARMPPASDPDTLAMGAADSQNASSLEDAASSLLDHQPPTGPGTMSRELSPHRLPRGARTCGTSSPQSFYLRRYFLAGMALLCALLVAVLEILNYFSNREQGFVSAPGGVHYYLWRYGPAFGECEPRSTLSAGRRYVPGIDRDDYGQSSPSSPLFGASSNTASSCSCPGYSWHEDPSRLPTTFS